MKILTVVGARPQFVKAAVVSRALADHAQEFLLHTGQHYDPNMSEVFFREMQIPRPDKNLEIHGLPPTSTIARMMEGISATIEAIHPDLVLVYGDTTSTLAGALTGVQHHIPVAHVEAGMRSGNLAMPEEVNRLVTDRISSLLLAPTHHAEQNLYKEGYHRLPYIHIERTGDVMYDAALFYLPQARKPETDLPREFDLCTLHRAEILASPHALIETFETLSYLAQHSRPIVVPLHPHTSKILQTLNYKLAENACTFIAPTSYFETLWLLQHSNIVLTDSGGLQREAYFFNKPCITLRDETEWTELLESGMNILGGTTREGILKAYEQIAHISVDNLTSQLFGDGHAGEKIVALLLQQGKL